MIPLIDMIAMFVAVILYIWFGCYAAYRVYIGDGDLMAMYTGAGRVTTWKEIFWVWFFTVSIPTLVWFITVCGKFLQRILTKRAVARPK